MGREKPNGDIAYLRSLPPGEAARIMGSKERLQQVYNEVPLDDVLNQGKNPDYRLERMGAGAPAKLTTVPENPAVSSGSSGSAPVVTAPSLQVAPTAPKTVADFIQAGRAITATLPDGVTDARACHTALLDLLQREVGISTPCKVASTGEGAKLVKQASQLYPDSWTTKADQFGNLYTKTSATTRGYALTTDTPPSFGAGYNLTGFGFVKYEQNAGYIIVRKGDVGNAVHEYAHRLQKALPELDKLFQELHTGRVASDPVRRLKDLLPHLKYSPAELAREDNYSNPYQGKEYSIDRVHGAVVAKDGGALEVLTMGFQNVLGLKPADSRSRVRFEEMYAKDRDMFDFVVGLLRHWKP